MSKDKPNVGSRSDVSEQPTAGSVAERRKRLAHLIGQLLARNWLQQRRQTGNGSDSPDDTGA